jgi:hypothetical protein
LFQYDDSSYNCHSYSIGGGGPGNILPPGTGTLWIQSGSMKTILDDGYDFIGKGLIPGLKPGDIITWWDSIGGSTPIFTHSCRIMRIVDK